MDIVFSLMSRRRRRKWCNYLLFFASVFYIDIMALMMYLV